MKFIDESQITVTAGKGGNGCLSFRREKYIPRGGPDGADGGRGGSIYLVASDKLNTLVEFAYKHLFKAQNGRPGMGKQRTGRCGDDLYISVPLGTIVGMRDTGECLGDLTKLDQRLLVAKGGDHGLGNIRFKSSVNRAPRKTTNGEFGEKFHLKLQLQVLADIGLLGLPNAGKSTLIRDVSSAKPKVADYPFTTLRPNLGVVRAGVDRSFVMADIPGLIEGSSDGAGLGHRFLKHLSRTRILLHMVDVAPLDGSDPVLDAKNILQELKKYSEELYNKPRWLVFNKIDLISEDECHKVITDVTSALDWQGDHFKISALKGVGTKDLCWKIMDYLEEIVD